MKRFRVYKKSIEFYRVEEKKGSGWIEIETDKDISKLLLNDCETFVDNSGRLNTINNEFKSSKDVPVHAWILCNSYEINSTLQSPDGILFYNPFKMKEFCDRQSFEDGEPIIIKECNYIGVDGNKLVYSEPTVFYKDKTVFHENYKIYEMFNKLFNINKVDILNTFGENKGLIK
jgi:hypothetical protein